MKSDSEIDYKCFDEVISHLRAEGQDDTADRLHLMLHRTAWTSGSELLGELGLELLKLKRSRDSRSAELNRLIDNCIEMVRRVWPDIE